MFKSYRRNAFGLLKAILTGTCLGFVAVLAASLFMPQKVPVPVPKGASLLVEEANHPSSGPVSLSKGAPNSKVEATNPAPKTASLTPATHDEGRSSDDATPPPAANDAEPSAEPAAPASNMEEPSKPSAPAEPALVPAVNLKFPKTFSEEELTEALEPLLSFRISNSDAAAIRDVIASVARGDNAGAKAAIKRIADPAAKSFAEWRRIRGSLGDFDDVSAFRKAHPLFPELPQDSLTEKAMFLSSASGAEVLKFYTNRTPMTGAGKASLGGALLESGDRERGLELIKFTWRRYNLDPVVQERFIERFGSLLDPEDQRYRQLMIEAKAHQADDPGKKTAAVSEGKGLKGAAKLRAKRAATHGYRRKLRKKQGIARRGKGRGRHGALAVDAPQKEAALTTKPKASAIGNLVEFVRYKTPKRNAHKAAVKKSTVTPPADAIEDNEAALGKNASQAKAAANAFNLAKESLGGSLKLLARLKTLRREGADDDVWSLLRSLDPDKADLADPEKWWDFRRGEVRRALARDRPATAYAIASTHGPLDGESRSEAEFLAGWVALRFMKEPQRAEAHFATARQIKGYARDEARAAYWLGRTKLALGARKEAEIYFREAASRFYTYYGSLARQALHKAASCEFRAPPHPTKEAIAAFVNEDAFKAVMIAKQLDLQPLLLSYVLDLARQLNDSEQMTLTLELIERLMPAHVGVRAAKIALLRGFAVEAYALPTLLPKFDHAGGNSKLEPSLLNALTRQESDFHTGSVSRVGARGLMQLMPQTAKLVAAAYKLKYEPPRLVSDPSYNVTLGSAFLAQLLSGYDGSYVLSLAAYNAGPGRVKQWIKDFGDPRSRAADPIDWVERIPFTETRTYIQRILESTQLYRCRFENNKARFQIVEDLHRGRPGKLPDFDVSGSGELEQAQ